MPAKTESQKIAISPQLIHRIEERAFEAEEFPATCRRLLWLVRNTNAQKSGVLPPDWQGYDKISLRFEPELWQWIKEQNGLEPARDKWDRSDTAKVNRLLAIGVEIPQREITTADELFSYISRLDFRLWMEKPIAAMMPLLTHQASEVVIKRLLLELFEQRAIDLWRKREYNPCILFEGKTLKYTHIKLAKTPAWLETYFKDKADRAKKQAEARMLKQKERGEK